MLKHKSFRSRLLVSGMAAAFLAIIIPIEGLSQTGGTGALTGTIYWDDAKTPVENAVVKMRNIQAGKEIQSPPSDKNGLYLVKGIPEGRYLIGVSTSRGNFNFNFEVFIKANETAKLNLALKTTESLVVLEKAGGKGFFAKPAGIALAVGSAALLSFGAYELFKGEEEKSPTKK
jgi:hypothetical protein